MKLNTTLIFIAALMYVVFGFGLASCGPDYLITASTQAFVDAYCDTDCDTECTIETDYGYTPYNGVEYGGQHVVAVCETTCNTTCDVF